MSYGIGLWTAVSLLLGTSVSRGEDPLLTQQAFDDAQFVKMAASDGLHEVMLGKIGTEKAKSAEVKKFAEKMVTDHTKANDELKAAAKEAGLTVPEQLLEEHQKHVDHFKDYKGDNFDADYMKHMVTDHEQAVALFTKASKEAKNKALRDFATKTLPTIQAHLEEAKKLQK